MSILIPAYISKKQDNPPAGSDCMKKTIKPIAVIFLFLVVFCCHSVCMMFLYMQSYPCYFPHRDPCTENFTCHPINAATLWGKMPLLFAYELVMQKCFFPWNNVDDDAFLLILSLTNSVLQSTATTYILIKAPGAVLPIVRRFYLIVRKFISKDQML